LRAGVIRAGRRGRSSRRSGGFAGGGGRWRNCWRREDVDAVTITSPSGLHGIRRLRRAAGKARAFGKPLDLNLEKCEVAIQAAKDHGVTLGGDFQQRFAPGPRKLKRRIERGFRGDQVLTHCETPWYRAQEYYNGEVAGDVGAGRGRVVESVAAHVDPDVVLGATRRR